MATDTELASGFADPGLRLRIQVAIVVVAAEIVSGADTASPYDQTAGAHDLRVQWANDVLDRTQDEAETVQKLLLGLFSDQAIAVILGSTLATVEEKIRENVDELSTVRYS